MSYILGENKKYHAALETMVAAVTSNNSKWTRCYHAKSDGFTAHDFHSRCDNKGPTVTLVQVREFVFGGFLDHNWGGKLNISIFFLLFIRASQKITSRVADVTILPV